MPEIRVSDQDLVLIKEWSDNHNIVCPYCNGKEFDVPGSLAYLPFVDLTTMSLIQTEGRPIIPTFCSDCGVLIALTANKVLPHYFK